MEVTDEMLGDGVHKIVRDADLERLTFRMVMGWLKERFPGVENWSSRRGYIAGRVEVEMTAVLEERGELDGGDANGDAGGESLDGETRDEGPGGDPEQEQEQEEQEEQEDDKGVGTRNGVRKGGRRRSAVAKIEQESETRPKKLTGFNKPVVIREPLRSLLGIAVLPRNQISTKLVEYMKRNNLQDEKDKRNFKCDDPLKKLFRVEKVTFFSLNKLITDFVEKAEDCEDEEIRQQALKMEETMRVEYNTSLVSAEDDGSRTGTPSLRSRPLKKARTSPRTTSRKTRGGLHSPMTLSPDLAAVCGTDSLSRPQVVKHVWNYIRSNELQDPKDGRKIICDDRLKRIFDGNTTVTAFGLNKYIGQHLTPSTNS